MPVKSYLSDLFHWRLWALKARNPTCGIMSLETGAQFFAIARLILYGSLIATAICIFVLSINTIEYIFPDYEEEDLPREVVEYMNFFKFLRVLTIRFCSGLFLSSSLLFILSGMMARAIFNRDLPALKKWFLSVLIFEVLFLILINFWDIMVFSSMTVLCGVCVPFFLICGLIFTYSFIVSLHKPKYDAQNEDKNDIELYP